MCASTTRGAPFSTDGLLWAPCLHPCHPLWSLLQGSSAGTGSALHLRCYTRLSPSCGQEGGCSWLPGFCLQLFCQLKPGHLASVWGFCPVTSPNGHGLVLPVGFWHRSTSPPSPPPKLPVQGKGERPCRCPGVTCCGPAAPGKGSRGLRSLLSARAGCAATGADPKRRHSGCGGAPAAPRRCAGGRQKTGGEEQRRARSPWLPERWVQGLALVCLPAAFPTPRQAGQGVRGLWPPRGSRVWLPRPGGGGGSVAAGRLEHPSQHRLVPKQSKGYSGAWLLHCLCCSGA